MPVIVGVPLMVKLPPEYVPVTPVGNPVTVAPVTPPVDVYEILVNTELIQILWLSVPAAEESVSTGAVTTVIVPVKVCTEQPPEVVTV